MTISQVRSAISLVGLICTVLSCCREIRKAQRFLYERRYDTMKLNEALEALEDGLEMQSTAFLPPQRSGKRVLEDEPLPLSVSISSRARKITRQGANNITGNS